MSLYNFMGLLFSRLLDGKIGLVVGQVLRPSLQPNHIKVFIKVLVIGEDHVLFIMDSFRCYTS